MTWSNVLCLLYHFLDQELDAGASSSSSSILCRYYSNYEEPGRQILLLYGTEYGFSEEIARKLFDEMSEDQDLRDMSLQPRVFNSKYFQRLDFSKESVALCIFSTSGDGESVLLLLTSLLILSY